MRFDLNGYGEQPLDITMIGPLSQFLKARAESVKFAVRIGGLDLTGPAVIREGPDGKLILDLGALPEPPPVPTGKRRLSVTNV